MSLKEKWVPALHYGAGNSGFAQWEKHAIRTKSSAVLPERTFLKQKKENSMPKSVVENSV